MVDLPARPDLDHLRRQAKTLLRAAKNGDADAAGRVREVSDRLTLASAQLAVAREYGFPSWPRLKVEVERRQLLDSRDAGRLRRLLAERPELAVQAMEHWCDHPKGANPLGYVAMLRFDAPRLGLPADLPGTGETARVLIEAGAPVDGHPSDPETPLITAASYGDAEVARVLIDAGADVDAAAAGNAGGIPGGTALRHAAVFGMTEVVDILAAAGARIHSLAEAAAVGDVTGWLAPDTPVAARVRALVMAAAHERLPVIDELVASGTPIDAANDWGDQPLQVAAQNGKVDSVRRLLTHGANPNARDPKHDRTPLDWSRPANRYLDSPAHDEVMAILRPLTAS